MAPSVVRSHWLYASKSLASKDFIVVSKGLGFVVDCALARMSQTADRTTRKRGSDFLTFKRLLRQNARYRSIRIARSSCSRNDVTSSSLPASMTPHLVAITAAKGEQRIAPICNFHTHRPMLWYASDKGIQCCRTTTTCEKRFRPRA